MAGGSAREIVRIPLGNEAERRYGAPYWSVHRGDLQSALADAVRGELDATLELGVRLEDFAAHVNGVSVIGKRGTQVLSERGIALIGADGIWSSVAARLYRSQPATFRHRTAWRALVSADAVPEEFRQPFVHLWLTPRHQLRKDGQTPYAAHPFRVCLVVRHVFGLDDPDFLAAALLHDTIEDTTTDFYDVAEKFSPTVAA